MVKSNAVAFRNDNFLIARVMAAFFVLLGHSTIMLGKSFPYISIAGIGIHTFGLYIFFSISGYLIMTSRLKTISLLTFFKNRFLRIYPAYAIVILLWIFPLGALFTNESFSAYLRDGSKLTYLQNLIFFPVFYLPGVFTTHPVPNAVNGSIWSLPIELSCYLFVGAIGVFGFLRQKSYLIYVLTFSILFLATLVITQTDYKTYTLTGSHYIYWGTDWLLGAKICIFFLMGSLFTQIPKNYFKLEISFIVAIFYLNVPITNFFHDIFSWIFIPYMVLSFCFLQTPIFSKIEKYGDPSYGVYIWAFPIQQILILFLGANINWFLNLSIVTFLSFLAGYISWHLIEKRILKLKTNKNT